MSSSNDSDAVLASIEADLERTSGVLLESLQPHENEAEKTFAASPETLQPEAQASEMEAVVSSSLGKLPKLTCRSKLHWL